MYITDRAFTQTIRFTELCQQVNFSCSSVMMHLHQRGNVLHNLELPFFCNRTTNIFVETAVGKERLLWPLEGFYFLYIQYLVKVIYNSRKKGGNPLLLQLTLKSMCYKVESPWREDKCYVHLCKCMMKYNISWMDGAKNSEWCNDCCNDIQFVTYGFADFRCCMLLYAQNTASPFYQISRSRGWLCLIKS